MTGRKSVRKNDSNLVDKLRDLVVAALEDVKGVDIVVMDVRKLTDITDYMVLASGTSNRNVRALADSVVESAKKGGLQPLGVEGKEGLEWVLIDLGDVVVHVMHPDSREFYDLESLWSDFGTESQ